MRASLPHLFAFLLLAVVPAAAAPAHTGSGLYGQLTLGVDGSTVTGVFSDARPGNGTEDDPQFSCTFLLRGTLAAGIAKVVAWTPPGHATTTGTLTLANGSASLSLAGNPPGCEATGDTFVASPYTEPSVKDGAWIAVRLVTAPTAVELAAPVAGDPRKAILNQGDVVVVYRRIGAWVEGEAPFASQTVRGWLRESDLAPAQP